MIKVIKVFYTIYNLIYYSTKIYGQQKWEIRTPQ